MEDGMRNPAKPGHTRSRHMTTGLVLAAVSMTVAACTTSSSSGGGTPSGSSSDASGSSLVLTTPKATGHITSLNWDLPYGEPTTLDYVKAADYSPDMVVSNLC